MPDQLQLRGGTTTEHNSFTGALREVTVDTTKKTLVVHDGASAGGTALMRESGGNAASSVQIGSGGVNAFTIDSNQDITLTGASANIVFDKSDNALEFADNAKAKFGTAGDLEIFHQGFNSKIADVGTGALILSGSTVKIENAASDEAQAVFTENGAVELYFDNSKKLETISSGIAVQGTLLDLIGNGGNTTTLKVRNATDTAGTIYGHSSSSDRGFIQVTESGADFGIQVGGANTANMRFEAFGDSSTATRICFGTEEMITATPNGAVELYFDNVKQMETTSLGASIRNHHKFMTGTVTQRVFQASTFAICTRLNVASAGSNNGQGSFIRASANCSNIDDDQTVKFVVFGTGDTQNANNSYAGFSDVNLKQDIADASSQWDDIKNLRVRKYRFKNNPTGPLQIGCIAQEAETVSPGLIETDPEEGFKSLKYSVLYMKAIKCLQEAMAKIETLETKVAALEAA